jgi:hypothetical protein
VRMCERSSESLIPGDGLGSPTQKGYLMLSDMSSSPSILANTGFRAVILAAGSLVVRFYLYFRGL